MNAPTYTQEHLNGAVAAAKAEGVTEGRSAAATEQTAALAVASDGTAWVGCFIGSAHEGKN